MSDVQDIKYLKIASAALRMGRVRGSARHMAMYLTHVYLYLYKPAIDENRPTEKGKEPG